MAVASTMATTHFQPESQIASPTRIYLKFRNSSQSACTIKCVAMLADHRPPGLQQAHLQPKHGSANLLLGMNRQLLYAAGFACEDLGDCSSCLRYTPTCRWCISGLGVPRCDSGNTACSSWYGSGPQECPGGGSRLKQAVGPDGKPF